MVSATEAAESVGTEVGLAWLIRLRWWAVLGQLGLLGVARLWVSPTLSWPPFLTLIGLLAMSNLGLTLHSRRARSPEPTALALPHPPLRRWLKSASALQAGVLLLDTFLLTGMLYFSGGPSNPFSVIYLVHVTLAAVLLGARWTWILAILSSLCFGGLFLSNQSGGEHTHMHHMPDGAFSSHLQGMWLAFALAAGLIAAFGSRLAEELRRRDHQLAEVRALAARNERLASLTTLAAGAAHELGTPLGTIAIVSGELERSLERLNLPEEQIEDVRLIRQEVRRCREILDQLGARTGESVAEVPEPWDKDVILKLLQDKLPQEVWQRVQMVGDLPQETRLPLRALVQVLAALLKNAHDASPPKTGAPPSPLRLMVLAEPQNVRLSVHDTGQGMPPEVLERACDPFFTTKAPGLGMGLGLFLVRLFAERLNGTLTLTSEAGVGTTATLLLPRTATPASVRLSGDPRD